MLKTHISFWLMYAEISKFSVPNCKHIETYIRGYVLFLNSSAKNILFGCVFFLDFSCNQNKNFKFGLEWTKSSGLNILITMSFARGGNKDKLLIRTYMQSFTYMIHAKF